MKPTLLLLAAGMGSRYGGSTTVAVESSAKSLCIMAGGGLKKGEVLKRPVRNVDIVPTICQLVGNRMPKDVEGGVIYQAFAE